MVDLRLLSCPLSFCNRPSLPTHPLSIYQLPYFIFSLFFYCASYAHFHPFSPSFFLLARLFISLSLRSLLLSMSMLSIGNYVIMHYRMKYSFSDTNFVFVCLCLCGVDDGEAVCVFNKHNTATPHTLTALASNFTATHTHKQTHRHLPKLGSNLQGIYVQIISF